MAATSAGGVEHMLPGGPATGTKRLRIVAHLRQHIVRGLHLGLFRPGDRLPSTRKMSRALGADTRIVSAAYHELADHGLVELRARSGIYYRDRGRPRSSGDGAATVGEMGCRGPRRGPGPGDRGTDAP